MDTLIISLIEKQIDSLQQQLALIDKRSAELKSTIAELRTLLSNAQQAQTDKPIDTAPTMPDPHHDDELPEIEVEIIVDEDTDEDSSENIEETIEQTTEEELQQEATVEDRLIDAIEQPVPQTSEAEEPAQKPSAISLPHVDDIRRGISLGDRFLFQRELFSGDGEKMNKTIDQLNSLSTFDDALQFINKRFDWNKESQAYELFINLLHRRF